jgi:RsiW-degrading membrane proteinase PrsW (M82 family)
VLVPITDRAASSTFARRHGWVAVLLVGAALFVAEERTLVATRNPNLVPSAILLGAGIVPLTFVAFVYGRRLPYDVPGPAIGLAAFLGGVIGTIVAVDILLLRGFLSPAGHMAWTGIVAAALYGAAATRSRRDLGRFLGAFVLAVVLHTLWDGQSSLVGTAVVAVASLGLLGLTAHRAGRADARHPVAHPATA